MCNYHTTIQSQAPCDSEACESRARAISVPMKYALLQMLLIHTRQFTQTLNDDLFGFTRRISYVFTQKVDDI